MVQGKAGCDEDRSSQEEDSGWSSYIEVLHSSWEHRDISWHKAAVLVDKNEAWDSSPCFLMWYLLEGQARLHEAWRAIATAEYSRMEVRRYKHGLHCELTHDGPCHTPFWESGNEASIRVPRMFKSHVQQQYDKQVPCLIMQSNYLLHNDPWVWRKYINVVKKLCVAWAFIGVDRWRGLPNNHLQGQAKNLDSTPRIHLNSNVGKLSGLMVATRKYGGKYDMEANSKEG
jgi:hypothetical protein